MKKKPKKPATDLRCALTELDSLGENRSVLKRATIIFRVSATEKEEIRTVAESLGLSVSGYLLDLHRIARERLRP